MNHIEQKQQQIEATMRLAPVIPVVVIDDARAAVPMARALVAGGTPAIEVTLRTPAALDAIRAIAAEVEGAMIGVGTVLTAKDLEAARGAGARFAVSPGVSPRLLDAADDSDLPLLPGAATASEAMALLERGYTLLEVLSRPCPRVATGCLAPGPAHCRRCASAPPAASA